MIRNSTRRSISRDDVPSPDDPVTGSQHFVSLLPR
jgi:hypothetical protein